MKLTIYLIIPDFFVVVDHSSTKAPSRVYASASDWNGGQVHHKHSKSYWQGSQHLNHTVSEKSGGLV